MTATCVRLRSGSNMKKYFTLQWKRMARLLPLAVLAALILCVGIAAARYSLLQTAQANDQKFSLAMCGNTEDTLVQLGITLLRSMDETRFSAQILTMTEAEALRALEHGDIAAYVVIPEGFVDAALYGNVPTMRYVTTAGSAGIAAVFRQEVTQVISDILLSAQKGVYGISDALWDNGLGHSAYTLMNDLCLDYVELAFSRGQTHTVQVLGIGSGLDLGDYLTCGLAVLLTLLLCLPFAPMLVQNDFPLNRMLTAKGKSAAMQAFLDFAVFLLGLVLLLAAIWLALWLGGSSLPMHFMQLLPVAVLAASLSFLAFTLAQELISGVLLQFLAAGALCFVSGCMYPVFFFPEAIQRLAALLPTGIARDYLAKCITGDDPWLPLAVMAAYSAAFLASAILLRRYRILYTRRAAP